MGYFQNKVKQRRKEKEWSQIHLAAMIDVSQQYIARIESGEINPGLAMAEKIAKALGCELRLLLK